MALTEDSKKKSKAERKKKKELKEKAQQQVILKDERSWYVLYTYSGYEDAVSNDLRQRIESMNMQNYIFDVLVPKEKKYKIKDGEKIEENVKMFSGYVFVEMIVTRDSWSVVRNTPGVRGFVGADNVPIPVQPEEFLRIQKKISEDEGTFKADFKLKDEVQIIEGPFIGYKGEVEFIDHKTGKLKVSVNLFDRKAPVETEFSQVKKVE